MTIHIRPYNEEKRQHHLALHYSLRMDPGFAKVGGLRRVRIVSLIYSWGMGFQLGGESPQIPNQELPPKLKALIFVHFIQNTGQ